MASGFTLKTGYATATGVVIDAETGVAMIAQARRVRGWSWACGASGGTIVFRDGGSGSTVKIQKVCPAAIWNDTESWDDSGIMFYTNIYVTLPSGASVTVYYE